MPDTEGAGGRLGKQRAPCSAFGKLRPQRALQIGLLGVALLAVPAALAVAESTFHAFPLGSVEPSELERVLGEMLPELSAAGGLVVDRQHRQLLVRGTDAEREIVAELLQRLQPAGDAPGEAEHLATYIGGAERLPAAVQSLRARYGDCVRISRVGQSDKWLVRAPAGAHRQLASQFPTLERGAGGDARGGSQDSAAARMRHADGNAGSGVASATATAAGAIRPGPASASLPETPVWVQLRHKPLQVVERQLQELLGQRLEASAASTAHESYYVLRDARGRPVRATFDFMRNACLLAGPPVLVEQWRRFLGALDLPAQEKGSTVRLLPLNHAHPEQLKFAVEAWRGANPPTPPSPGKGAAEGIPARDGGAISAPAVPAQPAAGDQSRGAQPASVRRAGGQLWDATAGAAALVQFTETPVESGAEPPGDVAEMPEARQLREMATEVEIETLPDLNVVILRGRTRDVEEISRIIQQLERLSRDTQPQVELYYFRHARDAAVSTIVEQVNEELTSGRPGKAVVIPLVKPNALLMIGWGEALATVRALVERLDDPVNAPTQLRTFALQHATAQQLAQTITSFFSNRTGLGPQVIVNPDARTNTLVVHAAPRDMSEVELMIQQLDAPHADAVRQVQVFQLRHSLAADVAATLQNAITAARGGTDRKSALLELVTVDVQGERLLQAGMLEEVEVTPNLRANSLVVTGPPDSLQLIALLIEKLDTPIGTAQIKIFKIINGDAADLIEMLRSLLPSAPNQMGPQLPTAESEGSLVPLRFSLDSRTNSIIAAGSSGDLRIVEALLLRLDERDVQQRRNSVYRLQNAPALAVAEAINEFLRSERQVQLATPQATNLFQQIEREVVVVPEPVSNTLILSATPRYFEDIYELIKQLDKPPAQVVIQVLIGEVQLNDAHEFGIELGLQDSVLFDRSLLGDLITTTRTAQQSTPAGIVTVTDEIIQAASNTPGFNFNSQQIGNSGSNLALSQAARVGTQGIANFALGRINSELGFGGLVLSASSDTVSVLLRALQESRRLEILSRPQVTTLDNQPAFIQVGQRVPRITGTSINQIGQNNSVELENVGLILGVTPRISPEGMVVMEIDAEKSEVGPLSEGIPISVTADGTPILSPRVDITTAQTTVSAASGETIVLGGLITRGVRRVERRVPYLSQIPILGQLFRFDGEFGRRSELLIVLTPHVIRTPEEMERIKRTESARMSWCSADLHEMHGPVGLCAVQDCQICQSETLVIYPDHNPRGALSFPASDAAGLPWSETDEGTLELLPPGDQPPPGAPQSPAGHEPSLNRASDPAQLPEASPDRTLPTPPQPGIGARRGGAVTDGSVWTQVTPFDPRVIPAETLSGDGTRLHETNPSHR